MRKRRLFPAAVVAAAVVSPSHPCEAIDAAEDVDSGALFEVGSLTKPMTAVLLAQLVLRGEVGLASPVGDVLGTAAGGARDLTLLELATHRAGLPRLAPNARARARPGDPYADYGMDQLIEGLAATTPRGRGHYRYSNFGYQLLGAVLEAVGGMPFSELLQAEVLGPAGCRHAAVADGRQPLVGRLTGHAGAKEVGYWHHPLAGAGGVLFTLGDLRAWLGACIEDESPVREAVDFTLTVRHGTATRGHAIGWQWTDGVAWHNGRTGGFSAVAVLSPPRLAVGAMTNVAVWPGLDGKSRRYVVAAAKNASLQ